MYNQLKSWKKLDNTAVKGSGTQLKKTIEMDT